MKLLRTVIRHYSHRAALFGAGLCLCASAEAAISAKQYPDFTRINISGADATGMKASASGNILTLTLPANSSITAAALKLLPKPVQVETALIALESPARAIEVLGALRAATEDTLAAFELMPRIAIEAAVTHVSGQRDPFGAPYPWYALLETHETAENGGNILETILAGFIEKGLIADAAVAQNQAQARAFWSLREAIVEAQRHLGASLKHDLAVPVGRMAAFIEKGSQIATQHIPGVKIYAFGHVGDGNVHFNLGQPDTMDTNTFTAKRESMAALLHDVTREFGGAISAEHGIGRFKRAEFHRTVDPAELGMMKKMKLALDPNNLLNPGVLF